MSLGLGIFLLVLGGILAFGVRDQFSGVDLSVVGYVLMAGGVLTIILYFIVMGQRRASAERQARGGGAPPAV